MKKIFSIFAMAAVVLASCVKEQAPVAGGDPNEIVPSGELVEKVFTVGDVESKTYIDGTVANNRVVIKWCADDAISVWDGVANRKFTMVGEPNGASATFKGLVDANSTDFYAIYPYDENLQYSYDEANKRMVFTVNKPAVQYANPEGGLADDSAYACGKADVDGKISFVNRSTLLKFSLANGMNVKSLKLSGNEDDDILAGTLDIRYKDNNFTAGWKSAGKSTEITFCNEDGSNLKTGVDYYISMIGNTFGKGYSVTLTFDDGTSVTRDSDKSIQYMSNQIYSLASQPLSMSMFEAGEEDGEDTGDPLTSYYAAYTAGQDIMIAGKAYNKTTHPNATLLTKTTSITANGLYFLAPEEGQTITLGTTAVGNIVIVGDNPSARTEIVHSGFRLNAAAKVAALNIIFPDYGQQLVQEAAAGADYVAFDNCKIYPTSASSAGICYNGTSAATAIKEFVMVNSEYVFSKATARRDGAMMLNCVIKDASITLHNNMFYVNEPDVATWKFKLMSVPGKAASLVMTNNTFVDMLVTGGDTGYSKSGVDYESMTVQDNLFYVSQSTEAKNQFVFNGSLTPSSITVSNNAYYQVESITTQFNMFGTTPAGQQKTPTKLTESPFSSLDHAKGVFVKTEAAASYGATR